MLILSLSWNLKVQIGHETDKLGYKSRRQKAARREIILRSSVKARAAKQTTCLLHSKCRRPKMSRKVRLNGPFQSSQRLLVMSLDPLIQSTNGTSSFMASWTPVVGRSSCENVCLPKLLLRDVLRTTADESTTVDWRLLPTLSFLYLMCSLDKSNAGNAKVGTDARAILTTSGAANLLTLAIAFRFSRGCRHDIDAVQPRSHVPLLHLRSL